jgi:hypothetical protein
MGKSRNRDLAFNRAKFKDDPVDYIKELDKSKHAKHKKIVPYLKQQFTTMMEEAAKNEIERRDFKKKIMS